MTDERIQLWNLLHDGEITAVSDEASPSVRIFVSIPFLRRRLPPLGDSFVITLSDVSLIEFRHFDGEVSSLGSTLEIGGPEILSTDSQAMPITVETSLGQLRLAFESLGLSLDSGEALSFDEFQRACEGYWSDFRSRRGDLAAHTEAGSKS